MARKATVTNADLTAGVEDEPLLPMPMPDLPLRDLGFEMSDEPFEGQVPSPEEAPDPAPLPPLSPSPPPYPQAPGTTRYHSRIHIVDAWQYQGSLRGAPDFIDRNWASWGDYDEWRKIPAGPSLRVPTPGPLAEKLCRIADYVVRQEVTLISGLEPEEQVDVWTREEFERLFIPAVPASSPPKIPEENHEDAPR